MNTRAPRTRFRIAVTICLAIAMGVARAPVAIFAQDATTQLAQAKAAYDAKNAVQAVALYTAFIGKFPSDPRLAEARYFLAESSLQMQDYANAGAQYKALIDASPESEYGRLALFRTGEIPYLLEKYDLAKPSLTAFVERFPYDPCNRFSLYYLGDIAVQVTNADEAKYYFAECMRLFPTGDRFADCQLGMAWVKEREGNSSAADAIYRELTLDTTKPIAEEAMCRWGGVQQRRGETTQTIATFSAFLARYPSSSWRSYAQVQLAEAYLAENRFAEALTTLQAVVPMTDEARLAQAACHLGLGRSGEADALLRPLEQNPVFADKAALVRATAAFNAQDWRDAISRYERLLETQYSATTQRTVIGYWNKTSIGGVQLLSDSEVMRAAQRLAVAYASSGAIDHAVALYSSLRSYARGNAARQPFVDETYRLLSQIVSPSLLAAPPSSASESITAPNGSDDEKFQQAALRYRQQDYAGAISIVETLLGTQYLTIPSPRMTLNYKHQGISLAPPTIPGMTPMAPQVDSSKLTLASLQQACSLLALAYAMKGDSVRANAAVEMLKTQVAASDTVGQDIVQQTQQILAQQVGTKPLTPSRGGLVPLGPTPTSPATPVASTPVASASFDGSDYRKTLQTVRTLMKTRQYAQADATLTQLLAHDISGAIAAEATSLRAETLVALKKTSEAIPLYESVLRDYPTSRQSPDALWALGLIYERRGDSVAASDYFAQIVEDYPEFSQIDGALYYLAWNELENGSANRAANYLQRIDRSHPQGTYWSHAVWTLAWLSYRSKNDLQARNYIDKILASVPDEAIYDRVLYLKGRLAMDAQSWATASAAFQELRRARPDSPLRDAADQAASTVRLPNDATRR